MYKDESAGIIRTSPTLQRGEEPSDMMKFMQSNPQMLEEAKALAKEAGISLEEFLKGDV